MNLRKDISSWLLALALVAAGLMATAAPALADVKGPDEGDPNPPSYYLPEVNPANACMDPKVSLLYGLKVEGAAPNWTYSSNNGLSVTIVNSNGKFFDWLPKSAPDGYVVGAVIVKAGTGGNVYLYPGDNKSTSKLHAPGFTKKGVFIYRDISNVTFCLAVASGLGPVPD